MKPFPNPIVGSALFCLLFVGCGSDNSVDELRAVKQKQLDMFNQVAEIYDEDLSYKEVQDRKATIMKNHDKARKRVKELKEAMPKADFDNIQKEYEDKIEDAKRREREAADAWGERMRTK